MLELRPVDPAEDGGGARFRCEVPRALPVFEGHFPGAPMLPGMVQLLALVVPGVRSLRPGWGPVERIRRLKFRRAILPEDALELVLELDDARRLAGFTIQRGAEPCASGSVLFAASAATEAAGVPPPAR